MRGKNIRNDDDDTAGILCLQHGGGMMMGQKGVESVAENGRHIYTCTCNQDIRPWATTLKWLKSEGEIASSFSQFYAVGANEISQAQINEIFCFLANGNG